MAVVHLTDADRVAEVAWDVRCKGLPDWSVDKLLCNPAEAMRLCGEVRRRTARPTLSDEEILRTLLNARKRGTLRDRPSRRRGKTSSGSSTRPSRRGRTRAR